MKILITGFEPFDNEPINPAWEAVQLLPDCIDGHEVVKKMLPCVFVKAGDVLDSYIEAVQPDFVFCIGQSAAYFLFGPGAVFQITECRLHGILFFCPAHVS
jgi:pyroglutamyl-peptidase